MGDSQLQCTFEAGRDAYGRMVRFQHPGCVLGVCYHLTGGPLDHEMARDLLEERRAGEVGGIEWHLYRLMWGGVASGVPEYQEQGQYRKNTEWCIHYSSSDLRLGLKTCQRHT